MKKLILTGWLHLALSGALHAQFTPPAPAILESGGCVSPAEAAAAKIKADQAGAKSRRAAVKYLGSVRCHYYPEAEAALIAALRADRCECVRLEAALALGNGCCCTFQTVAALHLVVSGGDRDGNPAECSDRVKVAAYNSLQSCLARGVPAPSSPEPPEAPPTTLPPPTVGSKEPLSTGIVLTGLVARSEAKAPALPAASQAERDFAQTFGVLPPLPTIRAGQNKRSQAWVQAQRPPEPAAAVDAPRRIHLRPIGLTPIGELPQ